MQIKQAQTGKQRRTRKKGLNGKKLQQQQQQRRR